VYEKGSYDEELKQSLASNLTRSYSFLAAQFKTCSAPAMKERPEDTLAYGVRLTKSKDDFTGSSGRKTRSVSVRDASPVTNIIEGSSDIPDRSSLSSLALLTSGGISM